MTKFFVISGTRDQFVDWRNRNVPELLINNQIGNLSDLIYVSSVHVLKGTSNPTGVFIGTWYQRQDMIQVLLQLRIATTDIEKMKKLSQARDYYVQKTGIET